MTRTRPTRASWAAAAVISPLVAAMAAGSLLWAAQNNPLAAADTAAAVTPVANVQSSTGTVAEVAQSDDPSLAQLRKKAARLSKAVKKARKEARAAREAGAVSADAGSSWVPSSGSGGSGNSGSAAQPAPAPAPEPPPADTWTGSSGG